MSPKGRAQEKQHQACSAINCKKPGRNRLRLVLQRAKGVVELHPQVREVSWESVGARNTFIEPLPGIAKEVQTAAA